ncbi:MAG TPA: hypothetical protein ENK75_02825 [Saprospiraceae bacterium]|nr:hypothetical protein [Saprospiraceae bacterium]
MAKIDEIAELIINELDQFNVTSKDLGNKLESIKTNSFNLDTSSLEDLITQHNESNRLEFIKYNNLFIEGQNKMTKNIIIPKWMIFLVTLFFAINITNTIIRLYESKNYKKKEEAAYQRGFNDVKNHFQTFIEDNPKVKKTYDKWKIQK